MADLEKVSVLTLAVRTIVIKLFYYSRMLHFGVYNPTGQYSITGNVLSSTACTLSRFLIEHRDGEMIIVKEVPDTAFLKKEYKTSMSRLSTKLKAGTVCIVRASSKGTCWWEPFVVKVILPDGTLLQNHTDVCEASLSRRRDWAPAPECFNSILEYL